MQEYKKNTELVIKKELLENFCERNNFIIINDDMLQANNMYKDIVYATDNNFIGKSVYPSDMPIIINKGVWNKLINVNNELKESGLCIKIYDAYRPIEIQKIFWNKFYSIHGFYDETLVANPNKYGTHNITINAVDISIVKLDGSDIELPCGFDDFSEKARIDYNGCSENAKYNRDLLINTAKKYGLIVNDDEWWHYYDSSLVKYGMKYNYSESEFVPVGEKKVFVLK